MKALIYKGPYEFALEDIPEERPGRSEVLVRVHSVGVCGSDIHGFSGATGRRYPGMVMGHEISGVVDEVGEGVSAVYKGQHVVIQPIIYCDNCEMCRIGKTSVCLNKKMIGVNMGIQGGLREYLVVPEKNVFPISEEVPFPVASLAEPFAVGAGAVSNSGINPGSTLAVIGSGMIGLSVYLMLKPYNPSRVFLVDLSSKKLAVAESYGASPVNGKTIDPVNYILQQTNGRGVDVAFEAVGISATVQTAHAVTKVGGTIVWVGNSQRTIEVDMQDIVIHAKRIQGIYCYSDADFRSAVDFVAKNIRIANNFVEEEIAIQNAQGLYTSLAQGDKDVFRAVVNIV